eukprot:CAMPEP_0118660324 /NCGR_PEP_ID=MMETSP0785-20121206/15611_1 /TAXON_ID=91992 /ORGANISM="Bolidomonas pacifica, Strain CCMP 1866" /LENGTH=693 /DNA_ID=CAMNT_0006553541 /DNA_START=97 /DNA_END=2175 /DNA_ORIENTATION=+
MSNLASHSSPGLLASPILYFRCQPIQKARLLSWCERQNILGLTLDPPLINDNTTLGLSLPSSSYDSLLSKLKLDPFLHRFCDYATIITHELPSFDELLRWDELRKPGVVIKLTVMPNNVKERLIKELPEDVELSSSDTRTHFLFATSDVRSREKKAAFAPKEEMKYLASLTTAEDTYPVYSSARYEDDPHICRAYWKLAEVFTTHPSIFTPGGNAVDVGSSPGGWTECLIEQGAGKVISIDPGVMDERLNAVVVEDPKTQVKGSPRVTHLKMQAEKTTSFVDSHMSEGVDLLVCDANMSPETVHTMLRPLTRLVKVGGHIVLTLKLVNGSKSASRCLREAADRFNGWKMIWGGHAMNNKGKERTVIFVKEEEGVEPMEEEQARVGEEKKGGGVVKSGKFWEEYHKENPEVDWITSPKNIIEHMIGQNDRSVLEVGCGTSELSKEMAVKFKESTFTATDVSPAAVKTCSSRHGDVENLKYEVLDLLGDNIEEKGKWGVVVDKGCLDTFMFRSPANERLSHVTKALDNVHTLLSPGGRYVLVSPRANLQARFGGVGWRIKDWKGWESVTRRRVKCQEVCLEGRTGVGDVFIYTCVRKDSYNRNAEGGKFKEQDEGPPVCPGCGKERGVRIGRGFRQWRNHVAHCVKLNEKQEKKEEKERKEKEGRKRGLSEGGGNEDGEITADEIVGFWDAWNKA